MLDDDLPRLGDRREVHPFVPLDEQLRVPVKPLQLGLPERKPERGRILREHPFVNHVFPPLRCSSQISSTEISAGLTPLMRDACPMLTGRIFPSFSAASSRSPPIPR